MFLSFSFVCLFVFFAHLLFLPASPLEIWSQARERKNTTEGISYCSDDLESSFPFVVVSERSRRGAEDAGVRRKGSGLILLDLPAL